MRIVLFLLDRSRHKINAFLHLSISEHNICFTAMMYKKLILGYICGFFTAILLVIVSGIFRACSLAKKTHLYNPKIQIAPLNEQ